MALNKYLWLSVDDARTIYNEEAIPADGRYRLIAKHARSMILEVVSIGHYIEPGVKGDTEIHGLVVRDQHDYLWQALYEIGRWDSWFPEEIRGFVKFTRVTEHEEVRKVFREVA